MVYVAIVKSAFHWTTLNSRERLIMKRNIWWNKTVSWLLVLALFIPFYTGCSRNNAINPDSNVTDTRDTYNLEWADVLTSAEIDTLNVVLVIDTSGSTLQNDPDRNWLEASCMFLNTLYASASNQETERLPGSKRANVDVVLYNDTSIVFSESLISLATKSSVNALNMFIRSAEIPSESGDSALTNAIEQAVNILNIKSSGQKRLSERDMILLFTDGYTPYGNYTTEQHVTQDSSLSGIMSSYRENDAANEDVSGNDNTYPPFSSTWASVPPDFNDGYQEQLEAALKRAKENNDEIFVLMFNPNNSNDGGWEHFKTISNYTRRNLSAELFPIIASNPEFFEDMNINNITWPEDYVLQTPSFLDDPLYGGGVFSNPDYGFEKVNYFMALSPLDVISFYTTLAANMLSGSSTVKCVPSIESYERVLHYSYNIEVPTNGISALMCFIFSTDGIDGIGLKGPDPDSKGNQKDYSLLLRRQDSNGWTVDGTMRTDWYAHRTMTGGSQSNLVTLTIIDPTPGVWTIYVTGKDGNNRSLHTYAKLVNGTHVNIQFCQGNDTTDGILPVTSGDFAIRVNNNDGAALPKEFYDTLNTKCYALRIPPWIPIYGEADITSLTSNFTDWASQALSNYKKPESLLTQMSGGKIEFQIEEDDYGNYFLMGHYNAPLPGIYYVTLNMTSGEGVGQIDYGKSFWVTYEPKTDRQVIIRKVKREAWLSPPYLPESWRKTSNTVEAEDLVLTVDEKSVKITPSDLASAELDPRDSQSIIIHSLQKGHGILSFDVTTEYGDRWTLNYNVVVGE